MPNQAFNADSLQRGICFANFTPRRKPLRRQAGSVLPVNLALGFIMITDKTTARKVSELMLDVGAKLDESVALVQATSSEHEFNQYRRAIGEIMGAMLLKVMNPLYSVNPELKPKELE